jgi:hypothetical protein
MKKILIFLFALICLAATLHAGQTTSDSAQSLYLQAGKEERSGSTAKARETYESIIDRFPESDFAVKANDRLLAMPANGKKATGGQPSAVEKVEKLFTPPPTAPLPTEPLLRRGVEAARLKSRAAVVRREEFDRLKRGDETREGHKLIQANRPAKEAEWRQGADRKVVEEFGMTLEEITARAETVCKEVGIIGECSEEAFYKLSGTK